MSNISRRKFLKGAGVAALAVAASGVLAGCSADDVIDKVATETLDVILHDKKNNVNVNVPSKVTVKAKKGDKVGTKDIKLPDGYIFAEETDDLKIDWNEKQVTVEVYAASVVTFKFMDFEDQSDYVGADVKAKVATYKQEEGLASWEIENYVTVPKGYKIFTNAVLENKKYKPQDGVLLVPVTKVG